MLPVCSEPARPGKRSSLLQPSFRADLIVLGTHGRRGLNRALLGSVAEKIVRMADVPVLTVHGGRHKE